MSEFFIDGKDTMTMRTFNEFKRHGTTKRRGTTVDHLIDAFHDWKIVLNQIANADFVIGYGFDNNEKLWKVYQNNERGMKAEWAFENEEEALEKLYKKVKFQYKIIN